MARRLLGGAVCAIVSLAVAGEAAAYVVTAVDSTTLKVEGTDSNEQVSIIRTEAVPPGEATPVAVLHFPFFSTPVDDPAGCWNMALYETACRADGITTIEADLRGGGDTFTDHPMDLRYIADGGDGGDRITGGDLADTLKGGGGIDEIRGLGGNDRLEGGPGGTGSFGDKIIGGPGNDRLDGGAGPDLLFGDAYNRKAKPPRKPAGKDTLIGGPGNDSLYGGAGADKVSGGPGGDVSGANWDGAEDRLIGGSGTDRLIDPDGRARPTRWDFLDVVRGWEYLHFRGQNHNL